MKAFICRFKSVTFGPSLEHRVQRRHLPDYVQYECGTHRSRLAPVRKGHQLRLPVFRLLVFRLLPKLLVPLFEPKLDVPRLESIPPDRLLPIPPLVPP
jgi:hypothetical protein